MSNGVGVMLLCTVCWMYGRVSYIDSFGVNQVHTVECLCRKMTVVKQYEIRSFV